VNGDRPLTVPLTDSGTTTSLIARPIVLHPHTHADTIRLGNDAAMRRTSTGSPSAGSTSDD
jgi:hypothetical protein